MDITEKIDKTEVLFKGNIFEVRRDYVTLPNGEKATRDDLNHADSSAVLAITEDNKVVLVKQYRCSVYGITVELPTGKLEKGEDPMECAIRELEEETGYKAESLEFYMNSWPAVGYCNEVIHIYLAKGLKKTKQKLDEDEFINVFEVDIKEFKEDILNNKNIDSKTVSAVLKYCIENNI
ncbi:NUDIX domain-containing protein [Anaerofustis stercorihominis]|uniref:NUDIX domain-containing protein n=1 Tax=Anaerofustis stercorihominis TaxID=214853 RepID=UPI00110605BE|nr:NUDIX hydrolase [Anaerofustis stercorihominis]